MPETNLDPLLAYLRQYGSSYDLGALRKNLAAQGYEPAAIEEAIDRYYLEKLAPRGRSRGCILLGISGGLVLGALSYFSLLVARCESEANPPAHPDSGTVAFAVVLAMLAVLVVIYPILWKRK